MLSLKTTAITITLAMSTATTQAQSSPYCRADIVYDNSLDFFDISEFLILFSGGSLVADFDGSGTLDFFDISSFLNEFNGGCPDLTDSDNDRLPDYVETNNGIYISLFQTGSDPLNPDTDADFLPDGDEVLGTTDGLILPNASPVLKDIYIECDWFQGVFQGRTENYRPTAAVESRLTTAFRQSGTPNPYGLPSGIVIHLDYGQNAHNSGGNQLPGQPTFITFDSQFNQYKADHFDPRRKGYYHYVIFANRYNSSSNGSSGYAEINGDDFMVTMVNYNSTNNMANTIAHELGHNLGLRHGGFENRNRKPNYNSVMNYEHQFTGVDTNSDTFGDGLLDYSHGMNISLNESALLEAQGVNGTTPIDWSRNGSIEPNPIALNLNCSTWPESCGSSGGGNCYDSNCSTLQDYDDWNNINWNRLNQSNDRRPAPDIIQCDNWPGK